MDIQALFKAISETADAERSRYHLTLGGLISALEAAPADLPVAFDIGGHPGEPDSYRGYYSDLAFDTSAGLVTAGDFLATCRKALGHTFEGYKGGDFIMQEKTPLWWSSYGNCSGIALMNTSIANGAFIIATKQID